MNRRKGLSWDNARKYIAAAAIAAMMVMPSVAMAKPNKSIDTSTPTVEGPIYQARSVSWS